MITTKDVEHIAKLARIRIDEDKKSEFVAQFNAILGYIEKLNEVDTASVNTITSASDHSSKMRKDISHEGLQSKDLETLTEHFNHEGFFTVPKII